MLNFCFLHLLGSTIHIVYSSASGVRNVDALFFMLVWVCSCFDKNCTGTCYAEVVFLHPIGSGVT
jgi:tetrahydromethanopterin S-methyltransferase subunit E